MFFRVLLFSLLTLAGYSQAQAQCAYDESVISSKVFRYIERIQAEESHNKQIINQAIANDSLDGQASPQVQKAMVAENQRNAGHYCPTSSIQSEVLSHFNNVCRFDAVENSCSSFGREKQVDDLISEVDTVLAQPLSATSPQGLGCAMAEPLKEMVNKRVAMREQSNRLKNLLINIHEGNKQCSGSAEQNILNGSCTKALEKFDIQNISTRRSVVETCRTEMIIELQNSLVSAMKNRSQQFCEIVDQHKRAVASEEKLNKKREEVNAAITRLDHSIQEFDKTLEQLVTAGQCVSGGGQKVSLVD